jgi:hypothetical protein
MGVNLKVSLGPDLEVDKAMPGDLIQHMIQKRDARMQVLLTGTVESYFYRNMGFGSLTGDLGGSHTAMIQFAA